MMAELTKDEWAAVYDWINAEKDRLPSPLKEGLMKLVAAEERRRVFVPERANPSNGTDQS